MTTIGRMRQVRIPKHANVTSLALAGGVVVLLGTWLPWLSFYAGLVPYRGLDLSSGRLLLAGGLAVMAAGVVYLVHESAVLHWSIGLVGFMLLAYACWSLLQLVLFYREIATDPMLAAGLGPGLFTAGAGCLLIFGTLFLGP